MDEILERQLRIRGGTFATFSTIEKALAGRKKSFRGLHVTRMWCRPAIEQRGPTTFDLRAILQKRDNLWATSNKIMYKTKDSQDLKLKREDK